MMPDVSSLVRAASINRKSPRVWIVLLGGSFQGKVEKLPRVEIVYMYADAPADAIDMWIAKKVDGIVLGGVGNGNMNAAYMEAVKRAVAAGIKVVRSTRIPAGRVVLEDEVDDAALGTIASDDANPPKARILLMLGLTQTKDTKELQKYFLTY